MCIEELLEKIIDEQYVAVPKSQYSFESIIEDVGQVYGETATSWLVKCCHRTCSPADAVQLVEAEHDLGVEFPDDLKQLLLQTNGADFYIVTVIWMQPAFPAEQHTRYHILSTNELVEVNHHLLDRFRDFASSSPAYAHIQTLNYLAFCDAHDGNYLAILLEGPESGKVFFLDKDNAGYPYDERTSALYHTVAKSLQDWLVLVLESGGWNGFGKGLQPPI